MGNLESQSLWFVETNFRRCSSTVRMLCSIIPYDYECRGMVSASLTPRRCKTSCIGRDSKLRHRSLYSSSGAVKRQKKFVTSASVTFEAS